MAERHIAGLLLAGGQARRMGGGDKCLLKLAGRPMLAHAKDRLGPQVGALALNANGDPARFAAFGLDVVADTVPGFAGPLAGVLAGLEWAERPEISAEWLVTCATDTPFFPSDFVARLYGAASAERADVAFAASNGRTHPVFGLWRITLKNALHNALIHEDERKIDRFAARYKVAVVPFAAPSLDPFFNVNRPEDLKVAEGLSELVEEAS